jgi:hypothetical protein
MKQRRGNCNRRAQLATKRRRSFLLLSARDGGHSKTDETMAERVSGIVGIFSFAADPVERPRVRRRPRARLVTGLFVVVAIGGLAHAARAQVVLELVPSLGVGATTNAQANDTAGAGNPDEFLTATGLVRLRYTAARSQHALGYRVLDTDYVHDNGPSGLAQELVWTSLFNLSGKLDLALGAIGAWEHSTRPSFLDPATNLLGAPVDYEYATAGFNQQLTYTPSARQRYIEMLHVVTVHYLRPPIDLVTMQPLPAVPETTNFGGLFRSEWLRGLNTWSAQLDVGDDFLATPVPDVPRNQILATALAGWGRALSPAWAVNLQGGALCAFDLSGRHVIGPAGIAALNYKRLPWYASLVASHTLSPNIFIGQATVNDDVLARATLPLTRSEIFYLVGFVGYSYAQLADSATNHTAYSVLGGGASLTARSQSSPFWASLAYTFADQQGDIGQGGSIPDRHWQTVALNVGAAFAFGRGQPPMFHGLF